MTHTHVLLLSNHSTMLFWQLTFGRTREGDPPVTPQNVISNTKCNSNVITFDTKYNSIRFQYLCSYPYTGKYFLAVFIAMMTTLQVADGLSHVRNIFSQHATRRLIDNSFSGRHLEILRSDWLPAGTCLATLYIVLLFLLLTVQHFIALHVAKMECYA